MKFGTLEMLALILIVVTAAKLVVIVINPQAWYGFMRRLYSKPPLVSLIAFLLAMTVLYFLLVSGVTIVQILAVSLFVSLLIATGLAKYADKLIVWSKEQDMVFILKEVWLYALVWFLLLAWGVGEIILS